MATKQASTTAAPSVIQRLQRSRIQIGILGASGLYHNAMSAKAARDLLMPPRKKTRAEREVTLKHSPREEFERSMHRHAGPETYVGIPAAAFKGALATAALATAGITKADVHRGLIVEGETVAVFGDVFLRCDVVRSADMARTPDVRTRAFQPTWGAVLDVTFVSPLLTQEGVVNLLANAGDLCGVGDFRQEKGRGGFGRFTPVAPDHPDLVALMQVGREQQIEQIREATPYDDNTRDLLSYFDSEVARRELRVA